MMNFINEPHAATPNFDLSHEAFEPFFNQLRELAKREGHATPYNDMYPINAEDERPVAYVMPIDPRIVKGVFHHDDDTMLPREGSVVTYSEPHRMYPEHDDHSHGVTRENITLELKWQLANSDLRLNEYYWITTQNGVISGSITPEYFAADGKRISPNNLEAGRGTEPDLIIEAIDDLNALERPLTLDDIEHLHQLVEVMNG